MQNPNNIKYLKKYLTSQQENTDINLLEKKVNRVRTHVNPLKYLDEHEFEGFENANPIIVDIGCAKGDFLQKLSESKELRDCNYIGFEVRPLIVRYLEMKFKNKNNMIFFSGNAELNIEKVLMPSLEKGIQIKYIFVNFPDPWIKTKHIKRRIISKEFLDKLHKLLRNQANNIKNDNNDKNNNSQETQLIIQTDVDYMYEDIIEQLKSSDWKFEDFKKPLLGVQSRWELQSINKGKNIYRIKCTL